MVQHRDPELLTAGGLSVVVAVPQLRIRNWARNGWIPFRLDSARRRIFGRDAIKAAIALRDRKTFRVDGSKHGRPSKKKP
ncbi:MAG TPA: hypothetical protein VFX20_15840 [Steroidobacteraceae bacterium]|nr:hypothetical protein [Steroidobacteraceae bacterium]